MDSRLRGNDNFLLLVNIFKIEGLSIYTGEKPAALSTTGGREPARSGTQVARMVATWLT